MSWRPERLATCYRSMIFSGSASGRHICFCSKPGIEKPKLQLMQHGLLGCGRSSHAGDLHHKSNDFFKSICKSVQQSAFRARRVRKKFRLGPRSWNASTERWQTIAGMLMRGICPTEKCECQ